MTTWSWQSLIDAMLEAVWVVDAKTLRIVALNGVAAKLVGVPASELLGKPAIELTATPEDVFFWEDVAAGKAQTIHSQTLVRGADGVAIPVERRVSKVWLSADEPVYVVGLSDRRAQHKAEDKLEHRMAELRATLESTGDGILVTDLDGAVRNCNRRFAELWGMPSEILESRNQQAFAAHLAGSVLDPAAYRERLERITAEHLLEASDVLLLRTGHILERVTRPQYSRGRALGRVFSFRDITQSVDAQSRLRLAAKVFDCALDAIFITDAQFNIVQVNPRCEQLTQNSRGMLLGSSARQLFYDPERVNFFDEVELGLTLDGVWSGEAWRLVAQAPCAMGLSWVALRNAQGDVQHTVCFFKDLSERLEAERRIQILAYTDVLTGLPNRLLLGQRADFALRSAQRSGTPFAVLFIDLDRFKNINDSMGHAFGDRVLVEAAERIKRHLRDVDTLCRLGGDEFVALLPDADSFGSEIVARRVLGALALPFLIDAMHFSLGCSIGIAMYPDDGKSLEQLIQCADTAMYRVKDRGRGNFRFYQPQMNVDLLSRMKIDHAMRQALDQGHFCLHYQPQISLYDGRLLGAEALLRWHDVELGNVSPATFIPIAEESGFIIPVGNWVLGEAVRQGALWQKARQPVVISVNVSALQFQQADFVERVSNSLRGAGLDPRLLELELTESILIKDANEALARLHALAALGVSLAIDDFGTGYSSLAYLKKFPISKLKIDRAFVMGLPDDEGDSAIVGATIAMARALKLMVVAEGVETVAQRDFLRELQCACYQGFLCSPALSAHAFEQLAANLPQVGPLC